MLMLKIIILAVSGFILLLLIMALIPVNYVFNGRIKEKLNGKFEVRYGIFRAAMFKPEQGKAILKLSIFNINFRIDGNKKEHKSKETKTKGNWRIILALLDKNFISELIISSGRIFKSCLPSVFHISGILGFQDPYYTGLVAAMKNIWPDIDIEPDFTQELYDLAFHVEGKIIILTIIFQGLRFLLSKEARSVLRKIRAEKKRVKNATKINYGVYRTTKVN